MNFLEVDLQKTLSVWWALMWRASVVSAIVGFVLGAIGGAIVTLLGRADLAPTVGAILGYIGSIPVSFWAVRAVLRKKYRDFSIKLVRNEFGI